jgi:hypothetical protein
MSYYIKDRFPLLGSTRIILPDLRISILHLNYFLHPTIHLEFMDCLLSA